MRKMIRSDISLAMTSDHAMLLNKLKETCLVKKISLPRTGPGRYILRLSRM